jgi:hypothetical protein
MEGRKSNSRNMRSEQPVRAASARPNDPDAPTRQDTFLRAIASLEGVFVHEGSFKATLKRRQLVDPQPTGRSPKGRAAGPYVPLATLGWPSQAWT